MAEDESSGRSPVESEHLALFAKHARDLSLVIALDGRILDSNDAALAGYGYSRAELCTRTIHDLRSPGGPCDAQGLRSGAPEMSPSAIGTLVETTHRRKDGTTFPCEIRSTPAQSAGKPVLVVVVRDITERHRNEQARHQSEERYRRLAESAFEGIAVHQEGRIIDINDACARLFGYSREEAIGRAIFDFMPESTERLVRERLRGADFTPYEGTARRRDGTIFPVEVAVRALETTDGRVRVAAIRDLTERNRSQDALRHAEQRFRSIFASSPVPITISTPDGKYLDVNDAFLRMSGYRREEVIGRTAVDLDLWLDDADRRRMGRALRERGSVHDLAFRFRTRDGQIVDTVVSIEPIEIDGQRCMLAIAHDLSDHKRLEEQLRQAQKMEAIGRLAGGVAHDFNNILTTIMGHSELLVTSLPVGSRARRQAEQVHRASKRASALTAQLLAFSRKQVLQPKVLDLNTAVSNLSSMLRRLIGEDIDLVTSLEPGLGRIQADPGQIEQVVLNFVVNARDAMPQGGQLEIITRNVELRASDAARPVDAKPGAYVQLLVRDTGCGMTPDIQSRVFEPFFTTKGPGKGTGLGLSTVYGIVAQSGGHVAVESTPGGGTTFTVWLPRVTGMPLPMHDPPPDEAPLMGQGSILLVEDDADVRVFVREFLQGIGYTVVAAKDGPEALRIAAQQPHLDLLLTDMVMPRMSGNEVASRLLSARPELKVLFISSYPREEAVHGGERDLQTELLQKPFSGADLARRVRALLVDQR